MFISALDLFKVGVGPSSSHTMGPMIAAYSFIKLIKQITLQRDTQYQLQCVLKGSLAFTGKGHATDKAVLMGLLGYEPCLLVEENIDKLFKENKGINSLKINQIDVLFNFMDDIVFDYKKATLAHANELTFQLTDNKNQMLLEETYCSIGGGFVLTHKEYLALETSHSTAKKDKFTYGFNNAKEMIQMAIDHDLTIAQLKLANECCRQSDERVHAGLTTIWSQMEKCVQNGLQSDGILPGGLFVERRAKTLYTKLTNSTDATVNDWLCVYAMAVNEENAAGHMVVTAPTNGAAGVIPAVIYYAVHHQDKTINDVFDFLLTAAAIGGLIKYNSSISGAEVGCQGEVGSAAAMAAAGLCAINGGSPSQIENAAEIALEHHLGMTCDPVKGLVQIPCIERNGFGAIKAFTASSLALLGNGHHLMSLDRCINAMKRTGEEMSYKYKETSLGGLAVSKTEC